MSEPAPTDAELELASAYVDGEASPEEAATVEADPRLRSLAARLGGVGPRLAVDEPPAPLRDDHVAAAMAAFDGRGGASVVDLSHRRPWYRSAPLGAAAAVLAVVALVGAFAVAGTDDGTDEVATRAADGSDDAFEAETYGDGAGGGATADSGAADLAPAIESDRPQFDDLDALVAHVDALVADTEARTTEEAEPSADAGTAAAADAPSAGEGSGCDPVELARAGEATVIAVIDALVSGREVSAVVVEDEGGRRVVVVDAAACDVVDERPL